jgi:hypothetical protein
VTPSIRDFAISGNVSRKPRNDLRHYVAALSFGTIKVQKQGS